MNPAHTLYHLARADFYERVRRYSFLVMLGLAVFLGYQVAAGNLALTLGQYRGAFNSAWVGAMMSLNATFFIGAFGFFLVKGSVGRDRETGVGQIMATTPLTRPLYMLGKWLSNLAVLSVMVAVLALAGILIQFWKAESTQVDLLAYGSPFIFIVLPLIALVAALAVLFEAIPFLQGSFGNIVYLVAFISAIPLIMENLNPSFAAFEPLGIGLLERDMRAAVQSVFPDYSGSFSIGPSEEITGTFVWPGIHWTLNLILPRLSLVGLAILLALFAALFFDRFDPSRAKPRRSKVRASRLEPEAEVAAGAAAGAVVKSPPAVHLTPLSTASQRFSFLNVLLAEIKLLVKGQPWWWYAIAGGLIFACFANASTVTRSSLLPLAWLWPVLMLSSIGNRELRHNVQQITFSSASPLWRQLPAQWLAGLLLTLLMGSGALVRFLIAGDSVALLALLSGAVFIPSLALACGVWSGASKLFEVLYVTLWYLGPLNRTPALDFSGAASSGRPEFFIPFSIALIALAIIGRARQVRT